MRFFSFILIFLTFTAHAEILKIDSLDQIEKRVPNFSKEDDVVIFDYSGTLTMPVDALLQPCGKLCLAKYIRALAPHLKCCEVQNLVSLILLQRKSQLVESSSVKFIKSLQDNEITTFCLTALRTGPFGQIPKTEVWRKNELATFGIHFNQAFPHLPYLAFETYQAERHPPIFIEGVLCSGSVEKGETLAAFFHKVGYFPKRVIFVDNSHKHHSSVARWMEAMGIEYIGFHYLANEKLLKEVDDEIACFQILYLIENKKWLSDEEVAKIINR